MHNITSKGQVTIPKLFRDKLGLFPNSAVEFVEKNGELVIAKYKGKLRKNSKLSRGAEMARHMTGRGTWPMTTDEIMALMRGDD